MAATTKQSLADLRALSDIIKTSIDKLEAGLTARGQSLPSLNEPSSRELEAQFTAPDLLAAADDIVSAAGQLTAAIRPPILSLTDVGTRFHVSSALRVAVQAHVAEALGRAGPKGLHVNDLAAPTKINAPKLARVLRVLATSHIFREVSPDVFAHNRISSLLDTGKSLEEILQDPSSKHDNTNGIAALVEHVADEGMKSSAYMPETLFDPRYTNSDEPNEVAFNLAYSTNLTTFAWFELPENAYILRRFGLAMNGGQQLFKDTQADPGFDWAALPKGSLVVDVGGGVGSQTLTLAKAHEHLKFVVQDRESVISGPGTKFWEFQFPTAISSGRVTLQAHSFFDPQPQIAPAIFMMRAILHDWSDPYCIKILRQLRAAAGPDTKLLVIDSVVSYACADPPSVQEIPGAASPPVTAPLLPNHGQSNLRPYVLDMMMLCYLNGQERTAVHFDRLFKEAGWKLVRVFRQASTFSQILGVPA